MKVKVSDIVIPNAYKCSYPNEKKIRNAKKHFEKHGTFDRPIIVKENVLVDGYIRYLVCVQSGMEYIDVAESDDELRHKEYVIGKFPNNDKSYVWKNPNRIPIKIGDRIVVESKDGYAIVNVVKCFISDNEELLRHKNIVRKI